MFVGEVKLFAGNLPAGFLACDGQLLLVAAYPALFAAIGAAFGGDGVTDFRLPDLSGKVALGVNAAYPVGASGGASQALIGEEHLPAHSHNATATSTLYFEPLAGTKAFGTNRLLGSVVNLYKDADASVQNLALHPESVLTSVTVSASGGGEALSILPPYLALRFGIATGL